MRDESARSMQLSREESPRLEEAAHAKALRWKHTAEFEGFPGNHSGSSRGGRGETRHRVLRTGKGGGGSCRSLQAIAMIWHLV